MIGSDCQAARHQLRTCQEFEGQACSRSQDDSSHRAFEGTQDEHGTDGEKSHASQSAIESVIKKKSLHVLAFFTHGRTVGWVATGLFL